MEERFLRKQGRQFFLYRGFAFLKIFLPFGALRRKKEGDLGALASRELSQRSEKSIPLL
jgi:hypothetical protein